MIFLTHEENHGASPYETSTIMATLDIVRKRRGLQNLFRTKMSFKFHTICRNDTYHAVDLKLNAPAIYVFLQP